MFKNYVRFAGSNEKRVFGKQPRLGFHFTHPEKPERVSFHTLCLHSHWFINVACRKFEFSDIEWNCKLKEELERAIKTNVNAPPRLLAIAYRQLADNAEANHRELSVTVAPWIRAWLIRGPTLMRSIIRPLSVSRRDGGALHSYTRLGDRYFTFGGYLMDSTVPADLLNLKDRLESWRATRTYARQPIPDEFRRAAADMAGRYSPSLVRRILQLDPWQLNKRTTKKPDRARHKPKTAFFTLPSETPLLLHGSSATQDLAGCRLHIERPDGARLTLTLPSLDLVSINRLCADFLRA